MINQQAVEDTNGDANFTYSKGGSLLEFSNGPPMLDKLSNKIEGLAFIGLSLTRSHPTKTFANINTISRQTQFDFNNIQDRDYDYFCSTNDDGWLVGGGENGDSFKLENLDSAHCEIIRIGTFNENWGGVPLAKVMQAMTDGSILIPHIAILPSYVLANNDRPPEVELKFCLERDENANVENWGNWQLTFLQNQLFEAFQYPGRFCPGPHHMTFVRKAAWKSANHMKDYFSRCNDVVENWRKLGPQYLEPEKDPLQPGFVRNPIGDELESPHGVYLFKDRNTILHYFPPNFHPPYNTPEKRAIISGVLSRKWNDHSLQWEKNT